jgi:hypothetical protein
LTNRRGRSQNPAPLVEAVRLAAVPAAGDLHPEAPEPAGLGLGRVERRRPGSAAADVRLDDERGDPARRALVLEQVGGRERDQPGDGTVEAGHEHAGPLHTLEPSHPGPGLGRGGRIAERAEEARHGVAIARLGRADTEIVAAHPTTVAAPWATPLQ